MKQNDLCSKKYSKQKILRLEVSMKWKAFLDNLDLKQKYQIIYGPMKEYSVERYMRDSLVEPHIEVVSDVQRLITARYFIEQEK